MISALTFKICLGKREVLAIREQVTPGSSSLNVSLSFDHLSLCTVLVSCF